jgi:hypothetical protein
MCDYSLAHYPNRLAEEGDQLVTCRFSSGTLGLTSQCVNLKEILGSIRTTAVCVPPGARLLLHDIPEHLQRSLRVAEVEEVIFIEQSVEAFTHRDAVRFANGQEVLLQQLRCGQHVHVLSLSGSCEEMEEIQHWRQRNQREPLHGLTLAEMQGTSEPPWVQAPRSAIREVLTFVDLFL